MDLQVDFDGVLLTGDLVMARPGLATDSGLRTAVILSLFSDARARPDDELPPLEEDPRGWWGDGLAAETGDRFGSRLWLLERRKILPETLIEAEEMAREATRWLIEDGICDAVEISAETIRPATLAIGVTLIRPNRDAVSYRFGRLWDGEAARWQEIGETA